MKAYVKTSPSSVIVATEMPVPEINAQEMLVKVAAIGVGIHDEYFYAQDVTYPYIIGIEGAGTIEKVGKSVNKYKPGERIAFISMMQPKGGVWAEYAAVSSQSLILQIPKKMSFEQAAAIPVAVNTTLKILSGAGIASGDTLFIAGGAGALGSLLIQIAKQREVTVIASASKKNHDYMKELGADYTVDYHDHDWQSEVNNYVLGGVDAAVAIHPGTPNEVQKVVKDGGVLVAVSGDQLTPERNIILKGVNHDIEVMSELIDFMKELSEGKIELTIDKVYPFSQAVAALEQVQTRHTRGKLVLTLNDD